MTKYDLVLFDLDGTISETGKGVEHCIKLTLDELDIKYPSQEMFRSFIGPPLGDSLIKCGISQENLENAIKIYRKYYISCFKDYCTPYDGIKETIKYFYDNKIKMAVATSKKQELAADLLKHIGLYDYFDLVVGSGDGNINKTKSDVILNIAKVMGINCSKRVVLIGDTKFDAEGAKNTGCDFIGVLYGYGNIEEMKAFGFNTFAEKASDLKELILL